MPELLAHELQHVVQGPLFPVGTKHGGTVTAPTLDVCKTPTPGGPVPIPYPLFAMLNQCLPFTTTLFTKFRGQRIVHKGSVMPTSTGDEAGTLGGVVSALFKGSTKFRTFSMKVKVERKPLVHLTNTAGMNGPNANVPAGLFCVPGQVEWLVEG